MGLGLAAEGARRAPFDLAPGARETADRPAEISFERRPPRYESEARPVVDHGESSRGQVQTFAVDARDLVALGCRPENETGLIPDLLRDSRHLSRLQDFQQAGREPHAGAEPFGQTLGRQMVNARLAGARDLVAPWATGSPSSSFLTSARDLVASWASWRCMPSPLQGQAKPAPPSAASQAAMKDPG